MNLEEHLSPHFTLGEMVTSKEAARSGIPMELPTAVQVESLRKLCNDFLEPVRGLVRTVMPNGIIAISSGFRSKRINKAIGGSTTSAHLDGRAADFEVPGMHNKTLARIIGTSSLVFDQLILEFNDDNNPASGWIHLGIADKPRRQMLRAFKVGKVTSYEPLKF